MRTRETNCLVTTDQGLAPFAGGGYKVFRNVKDYGARGDGVTDDSDAINQAIMDGGRCGQGCVCLLPPASSLGNGAAD